MTSDSGSQGPAAALPAGRLGLVRIVGAGLLGTSIGMALRAVGVDVVLDDASPAMRALARDLGAGRWDAPDDPEPGLVVVATPPDVAGGVVANELSRFRTAVVTDVCSVKTAVLEDVRRAGGDLSRYVGGHPMAGRERSGAVAARGDLFSGRPWVICPGDATPSAVVMVREMATATGANVVLMPTDTHDEAVARLSHMPQVAASLVAARLIDAEEEAIGLAGQGVRDVTRIAASDPSLWVQILGGNATQVSRVLADLREDLTAVIHALTRIGEDADAPGARADLARALDAGVRGRSRIPGKHGAAAARYEVVTVLIPDRPGSLGRLFAAMGTEGINVEELRLEHVPGRAVGMMDVSVVPSAREPFEQLLSREGWRTAD